MFPPHNKPDSDAEIAAFRERFRRFNAKSLGLFIALDETHPLLDIAAERCLRGGSERRTLTFLTQALVVVYVLAIVTFMNKPVAFLSIVFVFVVLISILTSKTKQVSPGIFGILNSGDPGKQADLWLTPLSFREMMEFELMRVAGKQRNRFLAALAVLAGVALIVFYFEYKIGPTGAANSRRMRFLFYGIYVLSGVSSLPFRTLIVRKTSVGMLNAVSTKAQTIRRQVSREIVIAYVLCSMSFGALAISIVTKEHLLIPMAIAGIGVAVWLLFRELRLEKTVEIVNQRVELGQKRYVEWAARRFDEKLTSEKKSTGHKLRS